MVVQVGLAQGRATLEDQWVLSAVKSQCQNGSCWALIGSVALELQLVPILHGHRMNIFAQQLSVFGARQ